MLLGLLVLKSLYYLVFVFIFYRNYQEKQAKIRHMDDDHFCWFFINYLEPI